MCPTQADKPPLGRTHRNMRQRQKPKSRCHCTLVSRDGTSEGGRADEAKRPHRRRGLHAQSAPSPSRSCLVCHGASSLPAPRVPADLPIYISIRLAPDLLVARSAAHRRLARTLGLVYLFSLQSSEICRCTCAVNDLPSLAQLSSCTRHVSFPVDILGETEPCKNFLQSPISFGL